jgi:NADH dehydrogenase
MEDTMSGHHEHVITGAYGYSGKYMARRLLARGESVCTLTNSMHRQHEFGSCVPAFPLCFDDPLRLAESMKGAKVLYNTYWVRFDHSDFTHESAVRNTRILFDAARQAGVERIVHVSITNPSESSPLPYFRGKAQLERSLAETAVSYAVLRPTVLFGDEDILVHNIAWMLRTFPVFGVFGDGSYRLQPTYVDDLAELAVAQGQSRDNCVIDAIGPETFTFRELVGTIGDIIGKPRPIVGMPPWFARQFGSLVGRIKGDVTITREEVAGLMGELLFVESKPAGRTRLTEWAKAHSDELGRRYASELARRENRELAYERL